MFEQLKEDILNIDIRIKQLRRSLHFVLNDYHYYHEGKEQEILAEKVKIIDEIETSQVKFIEDFKALIEVVNEAKRKTELIDQELPKIIEKFKLDPSKFNFDNNGKREDDKENIVNNDGDPKGGEKDGSQKLSIKNANLEHKRILDLKKHLK